jgi:hypothetical protein
MTLLAKEHVKIEPLRRGEDGIGLRARSSSSLSSTTTGSPGRRRKSTSLPQETVDYLKEWMMSPEHIAHPYPTDQEKAQIMADTGIELKQLTNWFVNNRKRFWKPRVEAKLQEQVKTQVLSESPSFAKLDILPSPTSIMRMRPTTTVTTFSSFRTLISVGSSSDLIRSSLRAVSEHSGLISENESISSDEDDMPTEMTKTERLSVHILEPFHGTEPSLEDVSVLPKGAVLNEPVLRSFENCSIAYSYQSDASKKMVSFRRLTPASFSSVISKPI